MRMNWFGVKKSRTKKEQGDCQRQTCHETLEGLLKETNSMQQVQTSHCFSSEHRNERRSLQQIGSRNSEIDSGREFPNPQSVDDAGFYHEDETLLATTLQRCCMRCSRRARNQPEQDRQNSVASVCMLMILGQSKLNISRTLVTAFKFEATRSVNKKMDADTWCQVVTMIKVRKST